MSFSRAGAIVHCNKLGRRYVLLLRRIRDGRLYYAVPGGKPLPDETPVQTARRELIEELDIDIGENPAFAYEIIGVRGLSEHYFLFEAADMPALAILGEEAERQGKQNQYTPVWAPVSELQRYSPVYPEGMTENILSFFC